ncbi:MAG: enoyl-CoA hydratase/isomerase family protein [Dehalococcoidia bacterium]|jgi:enoyl-CoA hydratase/carnithine racemase
MSLVEWSVDENVALLTMKSGENRFNMGFCNELLKALDDIENNTAVTALVVKSADEKIWCNGMDLDWLVPAIGRKDPDVEKFFETQDRVYRRFTFYPMNTVAALTGHAFAGGAILACSFDFLYMRADRGFLCFPEVDLNIPFLPYMDALIKRTLPSTKVREAQLTGKRYTAVELEKINVVRKACSSADETVKEAVAFAKSLNKGRGIVGEMKKVMNARIGNLMDNVVRPKLDTGGVPIK